jgi:4-amino-4-deoxy-L-arabinose transferase-like glycosyltransferase
MSFLHEKKSTLLLIALAATIACINLTSLEIQPYDEAYYALRAKAIVNYDCWLDQTDYAVGGFYSSSHPPLLIWLMAIVGKLFGHTIFSVRIWSVVAFVCALFLIRNLSKLTATLQESFFAVLFFGFLPLSFWFARIGQFDMLVTMFSIAEIYFYVRYISSNQKKFIAIAGVALGLALLSKTIVGGFAVVSIVLHSLYRLYNKEFSLADFFKSNFIFFSIGFAIGLSWFFALCITHDGFFSQYVKWYVVDRMQANQTSSNYRTGYFYYANLLLARFPICLISAIWIWKFIRESAFRTSYRVLWIFWFIVPFAIFSFAQTRIIWYSIIFLPPIAIIAAESFVIALENLSKRITRISLILCALAGVWSITQVWHRDILDSMISQTFIQSENANRFLIIIALMIVGSFGIHFLLKQTFAKQTLISLLIVLSVAICIRLVATTSFTPMRVYSGVKDAHEFAMQKSPPMIIHLVERRYFTQRIYTPHFSYYFNGIDVDSVKWHSSTSYKKFAIEDATNVLPPLLQSNPNALVVLEKIFVPALETDFIQQTTSLGLTKEFGNGDYSIYVLKK